MRRTMMAAAVLATMAYALPAASEATKVKLADYAFDFPKYGYEIEVQGVTANFADKLTADDYITIRDDGYSLKTLIDRMGRKDRQQFIAFFNAHCIGFTAKCPITASGDMELDEKMRMIFRMSVVTIRKDGQQWTNAGGN